LDRPQPILPRRPGQAERRTHGGVRGAPLLVEFFRQIGPWNARDQSRVDILIDGYSDRDDVQQVRPPGQIIILNGTPRSGKSSIVAAIQTAFEGVWMNLGVDRFMSMTPERYQPGIGLRPGGERPDLEPLVVVLYRALYQAIAEHCRLGLNVVVDVGHHDAYSVPLGILPDCARRLSGLPVLFVGVRCPIEIIMERRRATWGAGQAADGSVPPPVSLWQQAVHVPGIYDLEVDTSVMNPEACAEVIRQRLEHGLPPSAFQRLATIARTT
jgi:chloramphenicol 3-O phosphotransferase